MSVFQDKAPAYSLFFLEMVSPALLEATSPYGACSSSETDFCDHILLLLANWLYFFLAAFLLIVVDLVCLVEKSITLVPFPSGCQNTIKAYATCFAVYLPFGTYYY